VKQFDELYNLVAEKNEELPTIYCDMDMVLCDFLKGAEEVLGVPFPQYPDKKEKWKKISSTPNFWEKLNWMPGSQRMWNFINKYDAHILSAYSTNDPNSRKGKLAWLKKNARLSQKSRIHLVLRADKQKFAMTNNKPNLLIDDYIKNINEWESRGGIGIHHTSPSNTIAELKRQGFK
tara:strand:- start:317 stop:847 length:531 start_codon:yes stop_codon:yes gene_type:complete